MHFTINWIVFMIGYVSCVKVTFDYTASDVSENQMPDVINVTFKTETESGSQLHLRRSPDFTLDIPLYTLSTDLGGNVIRKKVKSNNTQNVSFYQDVHNKAVFKVYKSEEKCANKKYKFKLKGEFHMDNSKYVFNSENKTRKNSAKNPTSTPTGTPPSDDDDVYFLEKLNSPNFDVLDASEPPPPKKNVMIKNRPRLEKRRQKIFGHINMTSSNWSVPLDRHKREALSDYFVDVAAVIDYKLYSRFLSEAGYSSFNALRNIKEHYAFVFAGIDMLYQGISNVNYRIHIRLCKIYVTETRSASAFIDDHAYSYGIGAVTARSALERFVHGGGNSIIGYYDHAMLFTAHDLYFLDNYYRIDHSVVGIAYIGTMCQTDGTSITVIEDRTGYSTIDTAAHELGHSLSAQHDGLNNRCSFSDRYIMASSNSRPTDSTMYHPWQFSPCSINYFSSFLTKTADTSHGYKCLGFILNVNSDIPDVSNRLLGQQVTPDQQCKQLRGINSYYCQDIQGNSVSDICHAMYCQDPQDSTMCFQEAALIGTSCGDGKICINGECVSDPYAPQVNERCIYGDEQGFVYGSYSCSSFVKNIKGVCYNEEYYKMCCSSCDKIFQAIRGCEYGDNVTGCRLSDCTIRQRECCQTCGYGTPFTTTTTTKRTTPARTTSLPDCRIEDSDLQPDMCTSPDVCKTTHRKLCCNYCLKIVTFSSASTLDRTVLTKYSSASSLDRTVLIQLMFYFLIYLL